MADMNKQFLGPQYDTGKLVDAGASEIAENLSQWKPRKGDGGWPPALDIIGGAASRWSALLRAVYRMHTLGLDVETAKVLEVGSGFGDGLRPFLLAGFPPNHLTGIDLMPERLKGAQNRLPGMNFVHGNAAEMQDNFGNGVFDIVCEQFCFCHIPDSEVKRKIAVEMVRVAKPGGFIFIHDWRINAPWRHIYGMPQSIIRQMFRVGEATDRIVVFPSHLWPPIGNLISLWALPLYQLCTSIPPLVGSKITVLRKR